MHCLFRDGAADWDFLEKFTDAPERELHSVFTQARGRVGELIKSDDYGGALKEITGLKPSVDTFFDKVMVMAEDKELMKNRVRLLMDVAGLFNRVADFAQIQGEI